MTFYVKTVFINQTGLENLEFFSLDNDRAVLIPQQKEWNNIILSSDVQKVCVATNSKMRSEVFNIQASGISSRLTIKDRTKKDVRVEEEDPAIDIVYHINLSLTSQNYYLYTKIVLISPMFVLINDTDFTLGYI